MLGIWPNSITSQFYTTFIGYIYPTPRECNCCGCSSMNLIYEVFSDIPTVAETKSNFLKAYKRPIPSIYNTVLQELIVQQHLMRYKKTYCYDAVFALGFVTVYDQLMEGYPSDEDRKAIFQAYIKALQEDPNQYRPAYNFLKTFFPSHLIFH